MASKHQKIKIKLPKSYSNKVRLAIAQEAIDLIVERTRKKKKDKNGAKFKPGYSKQYAASPEGKAGGKKAGATPNMTLSGDMLSDLRILKQAEGEITIGFKKGSESNAKADGNIRGTYGKKVGSNKKARKFLGVSAEELKRIKAKYPIRDKQKQLERVELLGVADKTAKQITGGVTVARLDDEETED